MDDKGKIWTKKEEIIMRKFDYSKLARQKWDGEIVSYIAKINECKGREGLYAREKPVELERLTTIAKIQSVEASNRIEGIVTTSTRLKQLMEEKVAPITRDEKEIIGYRDVLKTIHESFEYIPIKPSYILQMHRDLLKHTDKSFGGQYKNTQNYINEIKPDGSVLTRFTPLKPYETENAIIAVCESYTRTIEQELVDPLLLIPAFICDFLCIHPFNDGNGRLSRLLTLLLLYKNGFSVGKYISIEKMIEKTKDEYYTALHQADKGWHSEENDPTPFIKYMLHIMLACYRDFEERVSMINEQGYKSTVYDVVKKYVTGNIGKFTAAEVIRACPIGGRTAILDSLKKLCEENIIVKKGSGRATFYVRNDAIK